MFWPCGVQLPCADMSLSVCSSLAEKAGPHDCHQPRWTFSRIQGGSGKQERWQVTEVSTTFLLIFPERLLLPSEQNQHLLQLRLNKQKHNYSPGDSLLNLVFNWGMKHFFHLSGNFTKITETLLLDRKPLLTSLRTESPSSAQLPAPCWRDPLPAVGKERLASLSP